MRPNKEVFNAELYVIGEEPEIALRNSRVECEASRYWSELRWTRIDIWSDSQVAIKRLHNTAHDPGQWFVRPIIRRIQQLVKRGTALEIHWLLGHMCINRNEKADEADKEATERIGTRMGQEMFASHAHVRRTISEKK